MTTKTPNALKCLFRYEYSDIPVCKGIADLLAALLHSDHLVIMVLSCVECQGFLRWKGVSVMLKLRVWQIKTFGAQKMISIM